MCGIAGYIDFRTASPDQRILNAMAHSLTRRGPDEQGTLVLGPCGFAHTRLSIIDVGGSPQPMLVPDSNVALAYNGELYNYKELRRSLEQLGETFVTEGDTEVVLRSISRGGVSALPTLDGMFALAAWDRSQESLLLARDPLGEKPLFYAEVAPGVLVFGSEPKALLEHPEVDRSLNTEALRQALRFRAVYGEACLHRGVRQLPPGHYLEFSREGLKVGRFHALIEEAQRKRKSSTTLGDQEYVGTGLELFMESVRERLIADVPVGAFLSGGLDSSLIVAAMRKLRPANEQIRTFSVGFQGDPHSELGFAQIVADAVGTQHTALTVGPEAFVRRMAELSACRDGPVSQPADVAIAEMSLTARDSVKVALSGEGADEIFGGYPKYGFANASWALRRAISIIGAQPTARVAGALGMDRTRALVAARALACRTEAESAAQWFSYFDQRDLQTLLPGIGWGEVEWERTMSAHRAAALAGTDASPLFRMQAIDCLTWLPGNMLERGDRMTMAEGLEVRPPFLDKELAAFGLALPDHLKIRGKTSKWIVRQWASELLPPEITNRPKWGFHVPLAEWFRVEMREMLFDYLCASDGLCGRYGNPAEIDRMLAAHDERKIDASSSLWTLLSAEVWYQDVFLPRNSQSSTTEQGVASLPKSIPPISAAPLPRP
ncbi:asparagine synthase (glutamine-hydrolyzing) [Phenylobacterium sp.]|uniref:asparagine synthase (glutamine-hydrolyzing) n=1 Tax=Phenylobacterium sp. TaxID=1871053 RepID=UPI002731AC4A|nr:asparagine synthase (glutamine-hydrolyzing) [Phenylobacterium sp.]MDP1598226.1 asparagine synthase (glutamine-hydrolyzing) [Phenylobacterium sp.]MDP3594710.1 asparagine synthase (glutamine-hydrolyzing) [Phenylobacterium sp.]